jgi:uncharacterized protein (TIGR02001 family)
MKSTQITLAALLAIAALPSLAQTAPAATAPESDWTLSGNLGVFSDYRFRGFTQTDYNPAIQGGVDFAMKNGLYLGNWNSNVSSGIYNGAPIEMDFYGGWKTTYEGFGFDVGGIYYYYPGTGEYNPNFKASNFEVYIGGSWGPLSLKYSYAFTDFFGLNSDALGLPGGINTKGSQYVDLSATHSFDGGFGINGHVGYQYVKNYEQLGGPDNAVWDYKVGVTYDWTGWVVGLAVVGTSDKKFYLTAQNPPQGAGKTSALVYVTKSF